MKTKRKKPVSTTARTLARLRSKGLTAAVVERWVPQARRRIDLFGCIDIIAISPEPLTMIIGVQTTTVSNISSHIKKALAEPRLVEWLKAGGIFVLWGWAKYGKKGERKFWKARTFHFMLSPKDKTLIYKETTPSEDEL